MKVMDVNEFARRHNMNPQRVRKLLRQERVWPHQRLDNGRYLLYENTVIVRPYERPNRKMRPQHDRED